MGHRKPRNLDCKIFESSCLYSSLSCTLRIKVGTGSEFVAMVDDRVFLKFYNESVALFC